VAGRAAYSEDEKTPAEFANARQTGGHALDGGDVDALEDGDRFGNECGRKTGGRSWSGPSESFL
jgi:hypothetical protein